MILNLLCYGRSRLQMINDDDNIIQLISGLITYNLQETHTHTYIIHIYIYIIYVFNEYDYGKGGKEDGERMDGS